MKKRYLLGIILVLVVFLTLSTLSVLSFLPVSSAYGEYICADYSITNISPTSVGINEEFTIGVQIEACGPNLPDFVSFELINPPTDITIKEPLLINITNFYSGNSERFIVYHMKTKDDAHPGTHLIKTKLILQKWNLFHKRPQLQL